MKNLDCGALKPDYVPRSEFEQLKQEVNQLKSSVEELKNALLGMRKSSTEENKGKEGKILENPLFKPENKANTSINNVKPNQKEEIQSLIDSITKKGNSISKDSSKSSQFELLQLKLKEALSKSKNTDLRLETKQKTNVESKKIENLDKKPDFPSNLANILDSKPSEEPKKEKNTQISAITDLLKDLSK